MTALAVLGIAPSAVDWSTKLIWNATASARIGFHIVEPADAADVSKLVAVMPSEPLSAFMAERGYIGPGVPLLKRVVGLPGNGFAGAAGPQGIRTHTPKKSAGARLLHEQCRLSGNSSVSRTAGMGAQICQSLLNQASE